jgi:DNA-binding GntR family transcriptional regulator
MVKRARPTPERRPKGTGSNVVFNDLRARILSLELQPGIHLDEGTLVETYGVSRTPVREALIRLGSGGLVVLLPNRGARVAPIELATLNEFFEALDLCQRAVTHWAALRRQKADIEAIAAARLAFETAAAAGSVEQMNDTNVHFHIAIGRAAGNGYIASTYERLLEEGLRVSRISLSYEGTEAAPLANHVETIIDEHRRFEQLIREGSAGKAQELASAHVRLFRNRVFANLSANLAAAIPISSPAAAAE